MGPRACLLENAVLIQPPPAWAHGHRNSWRAAAEDRDKGSKEPAAVTLGNDSKIEKLATGVASHRTTAVPTPRGPPFQQVEDDGRPWQGWQWY